jgi:hypothetical protein
MANTPPGGSDLRRSFDVAHVLWPAGPNGDHVIFVELRAPDIPSRAGRPVSPAGQRRSCLEASRARDAIAIAATYPSKRNGPLARVTGPQVVRDAELVFTGSKSSISVTETV